MVDTCALEINKLLIIIIIITTATVYSDTLFSEERTFLSSREVEIAITSEPTSSEDVPGMAFISCHVSEEGSGTVLKYCDARAFFSPVG